MKTNTPRDIAGAVIIAVACLFAFAGVCLLCGWSVAPPEEAPGYHFHPVTTNQSVF